jgi:hypothetical protein
MISPPAAALSVLTAMADAEFARSLDDVFGFSGSSYISDDDSENGSDNGSDSNGSDSASVKTVTPLRLPGIRLAPEADGGNGDLIPPTPLIILFRPARADYSPQTLSEIWAESALWIKTGIERQYWNAECVPFSL